MLIFLSTLVKSKTRTRWEAIAIIWMLERQIDKLVLDLADPTVRFGEE